MSYDYKYQYDDLASAESNYVVGEPHSLSNTPIGKVIVHSAGLIYTKDYELYVENQAQPLVAGVDYHFEGQDPYVTAETGFETAGAVVIDTEITADARATYRAVGGKQGQLSSIMASLKEAIELAQQSTIDFKGIRNKPSQWTPEDHTHAIQDISRWDAMVTMLIEIEQAIKDTRSLGSSALSLQDADKRILNIIARLQNDLQTQKGIQAEILEQLSRVPILDMDFGTEDREAWEGKWANAATLSLGILDFQEAADRKFKPAAAVLSYPMDAMTGISKNPDLEFWALRDIRGNLLEKATLKWEMVDELGALIAAGETSAIDKDIRFPRIGNNTPLKPNMVYTIQMAIETEDFATVRSHSTFRTSSAVPDTRIATLSSDVDNVLENYGDVLDINAKGTMILAGRSDNVGGATGPSLIYKGENGWSQLNLELPSDATASDVISKVAISPNGTLLAAASKDMQRVWLWRVAFTTNYDDLIINPIVASVTAYFPPTGYVNAGFGEALTFSGDGKKLLVSSDGNEGSVHIYNISNNALVLSKTLTAVSLTNNMGAGKTLACNSDASVIAFGTPDADKDGYTATPEGCFQVWAKIGTDYTFIRSLGPSENVSGDMFGKHLDVSGKLIAVSHQGAELSGSMEVGATVLYQLDVDALDISEVGVLYPLDPVPGLRFGIPKFAKSGTMLMAGVGSELGDQSRPVMFKKYGSSWAVSKDYSRLAIRLDGLGTKAMAISEEGNCLAVTTSAEGSSNNLYIFE